MRWVTSELQDGSTPLRHRMKIKVEKRFFYPLRSWILWDQTKIDEARNCWKKSDLIWIGYRLCYWKVYNSLLTFRFGWFFELPATFFWEKYFERGGWKSFILSLNEKSSQSGWSLRCRDSNMIARERDSLRLSFLKQMTKEKNFHCLDVSQLGKRKGIAFKQRLMKILKCPVRMSDRTSSEIKFLTAATQTKKIWLTRHEEEVMAKFLTENTVLVFI